MIAIFLFAIVLCLLAGLYHLLLADSTRTGLLHSLTLRVVLSVTLIVLLLVAACAGLITPHPGPW